MHVVTSPNGRLVLLYDGGAKDAPSPETLREERYAINWDEINGLSGRLLTLADATFQDREQRKAFKDLIRHAIREWMSDNAGASWGDLPDSIRAPLGIPHIHTPRDLETQAVG